MNTPATLCPQQGQQLFIYVLFCEGCIEAIYTHKVQMEAAKRHMESAGYSCAYREFRTEPHDNNC